MADDETLKSKLGGLGIDYELFKQVSDLKKLYDEGKMTKQVYDQLVDNVTKKHNERKERENQMKKPRLRKMFDQGKKRLFNGRNNANANNGNNITGRQPSVQRKVRQPNPNAKLIIEDHLLRLGTSRLGKPKWKKVWVALLEDSIVYYSKRGDPKPMRTIFLGGEADFFVSEVRGGVLKRADSSHDYDIDKERDRDDDTRSVGTQQSDDFMEQPHLFLVSNLDKKYYFAAEDEEKKQYWVFMLTTIIRDIMKRNEEENNQPLFTRSVDPRSPEQIKKDQDARIEAYIQSQRKKTLRPMGKGAPQMSMEQLRREEDKWRRQGDRVARQSIALDLMAAEVERADFDLKEQEQLKRALQDKDRAIKQMEQKLEHNEESWQKKYDALLEQFRQQALERRGAREDEASRLERQLHTLKRMSVAPNSDRSRDYEAEIEMYKTKLKALQAALKVDIENLDWDGTLEDAEEKMKELVEDLMSSDPKVQQEAQSKFDQWDQIIRNHADYIKRETDKWSTWEDENYEKNLDALNEMREIAPKIILQGCSEQDLMAAAGIPAKTAARIKKNGIFRFFWMDKDSIARIHIADLTNRYMSQGLDIRELRAVYASLPEEFQLDSDGRKKQFRENIRNRLFELTKKEKAGSLNSQEAMNNAYRTKDVKDRPKPAPGAKRPPPKRGVNNNMKNKAMALQALLEKRGNGPPKAAPSQESQSAKPEKGQQQTANLDPDSAEWVVFFRMKKAGLPDGAIMNRMQKDGKDPNLWFKLVDLKEKGGGTSSGGSEPTNGSAKEPTPAALQKAKSERALAMALNPNPQPRNRKPSNPNSDLIRGAKVDNTDLKAAAARFMKRRDDSAVDAKEQNGNGRSRKLKPHTPKRPENLGEQEDNAERENSVVSLDGAIDVHGDGVNTIKKKKKKKTLRIKKKDGRQSGANHMLMADTNDLVARAKVDHDVSNYKRGSHGYGTLDYPSSAKVNRVSTNGTNKVEPQDMTKSQKRAGAMGMKIEESLQELVDIIIAEGYYDEAEEGVKTMRFGDLFLKYEKISDMLVGLLLKGKRQGRLKYRGDMLFNGIHNDIKITVL